MNFNLCENLINKFLDPIVLPCPQPRNGLFQPDVEHIHSLRSFHLAGHGLDAGAANTLLYLVGHGGNQNGIAQGEALREIAGIQNYGIFFNF